MKASALYRADLWRLGLLATRATSPRVLQSLACFATTTYFLLHRKRRRIVVQNLLPAVQGDEHLAQKTASRLIANFATKLADLWRYEAGADIRPLLETTGSWESLNALQLSGRGILLLTPHLGNWEFGAPLLTNRGIKLLALTQPEPQSHFTSLREKARARWGIETLVIGSDPFAFVEVIRRLEAGAVVALLVDRPPVASAVTVKLFGHKFQASIAAAELARATGCALMPVAVPREGNLYKAHLLPEIAYDRTAIGSRDSRINLTQEIMRIFEPVIRQHLDQWYHFVPLWQS